MVIDVDFEVYKALTSKRATEAVTYNDVIRDLLKLKGAVPNTEAQEQRKGLTLKGVFFPDGTQFRATYKGRTYTAEIKDGAWRDSDGRVRNSPSESAAHITGKNWNGWRFWNAKRPGDASWSLIADLRGPSVAEL
jgi:hypothetical protein